MAAANPADFGNLAKTYSEDMRQRQRQGSDPADPQARPLPRDRAGGLRLADGQVSKVIADRRPIRDLEAREIDRRPARSRWNRPAAAGEDHPRSQTARRLRRSVPGRCRSRPACRTCTTIRCSASRQMPGTVALINGLPITTAAIGRGVHRPPRRRGARRHHPPQADRGWPASGRTLRFPRQEIDAEIARAAAMMVRRLPDGSPDVKAWLDLVTKKQGVSVELYRRDAVWPAVALQKLAGAAARLRLARRTCAEGSRRTTARASGAAPS